MATEPKATRILFLKSNDAFPNSRLPVLVYIKGFAPQLGLRPADIENQFHQNGWANSWRNGLYSFHHYHSTAHEALGLYSGWVTAQIGGPGGERLTLEAGDVIILPAGVAHTNIEQSSDFQVVGAYPDGQVPDMKYGKPGERPHTEKTIAKVALPLRDPVFGLQGALLEEWRAV